MCIGEGVIHRFWDHFLWVHNGPDIYETVRLNAGRVDPSNSDFFEIQAITSVCHSVSLISRPFSGAAPSTITFLVNLPLHFAFLDSLSFHGTERSSIDDKRVLSRRLNCAVSLAAGLFQVRLANDFR
jgi:hypothetical protein